MDDSDERLTATNSIEWMAPHLADSQHAMIQDMVTSKLFEDDEIANTVGCSPRGVQRIKQNLHFYGKTKAPSNGVGRPRSIRPPMLDALCEHLLEKPGLYLDKMKLFLWDEFEVFVSTFSIRRALKSIGWTKKTIHRVAKGRNADLRDFYLHNISDFPSWQFVYVDESGCIGFRRTGWSPLGVTPTQVAHFQSQSRFLLWIMLPSIIQSGSSRCVTKLE
jgi:transposase